MPDRFVTLYLQPNIVRRLWRAMLLMLIWSTAVAVEEYFWPHEVVGQANSLLALLGAMVGILLVFRNNTAYDRWWEGRKLWGQLSNDSRNLAIKVRVLANVPADEKREMGRLIIGFDRALKEHLRDGVRRKELSLYGNVRIEPSHIPNHIAAMLRERMARWRQEGWIDGFDELLLDPHARALMDICGGCERIRRTPISRSYLAFIRQVIFLYLFCLPVGVVESMGMLTIPLSLILTYFMMGVELVAEDVEEPFGRGEDDLVLDELCKGIDNMVTEILQWELDPPLRPGPARPHRGEALPLPELSSRAGKSAQG
ncbi:MAG: hypothetical protein K2R98_24860 [Gemmataceae bacterium]|nr:hypothetical protein [Gemmataceae bacterium]